MAHTIKDGSMSESEDIRPNNTLTGSTEVSVSMQSLNDDDDGDVKLLMNITEDSFSSSRQSPANTTLIGQSQSQLASDDFLLTNLQSSSNSQMTPSFLMQNPLYFSQMLGRNLAPQTNCQQSQVITCSNSQQQSVKDQQTNTGNFEMSSSSHGYSSVNQSVQVMTHSPMPLFPLQPGMQMPTLASSQIPDASVNVAMQLAQAMSVPLAASMLQQVVCNTLNQPTAVPSALNNANIFAQLTAQVVAAQIAQSAPQMASPSLGGVLGLMQALSSKPTATVSPSISSVVQNPSFDPAAAKQTILLLVKLLIQSSRLDDDDITRHFVEKLQENLTVENPNEVQQNTAPPPTNIKMEHVASNEILNGQNLMNAGGAAGLQRKVDKDISMSVFSSVDDDDDINDVDESTFYYKKNRVYDLEMKSKYQSNTRTGNRSQKGDSNKFLVTDDSDREAGKSPKTRNNFTQNKWKKKKAKNDKKMETMEIEKDLVDENEESLKMDCLLYTDEFQSSAKRLRERKKVVKYVESGSDHDYSSDEPEYLNRKRKKPSQNTSLSRSTTRSSGRSGNKTTYKATSDAVEKVSKMSDGDDNDDDDVRDEKLEILKSEPTNRINVLPNMNTSHDPEVRYLFMGRSNGLDWLNLVSFRSDNDTANQCMFCPFTSTNVRTVTSHIVKKHSDLSFVLSKVKQPPNRVIYLACRHCSYLTFESTLLWIHFELFHGVPGIMDGSTLPPVKIIDPQFMETISLDRLVNGSGLVYACFDCLLCSSSQQLVAAHVLKFHPDTVNFNGCFVKLVMVKTKDGDSFTYRQALNDDEHSDALKDIYICMLCQYQTHCSYLALAHNLRMHQQKRILYICSQCNYQCLQERALETHMSSCHNHPHNLSALCSTTLVINSIDGILVECEIPMKRFNIKDLADEDMKEASDLSSSNHSLKPTVLLQSTAVSSSQEKLSMSEELEPLDTSRSENKKIPMSLKEGESNSKQNKNPNSELSFDD